MVGNTEARARLVEWLNRWKPRSKAALLIGPPGTGKTTTVHVLAQEKKLNLVELNASDSRTKERLARKLGGAISSTSLFGGRTLVFLDEVDGLAGRADYGAIDFIKETVRASANPIVMAANNPEADEVRKLSSVTTKIEFVAPGTADLLVYLRRVSGEEGLGLTDDQLFSIAESSEGDIRYALNALQGGGGGGKDQELTASRSVNAFFAATDRQGALRALRAYPGQPREKLRDLLSSVLAAQMPIDKKATALRALSRADILMGRIFRSQDWRLLRYLDPLLSSELGEALVGEKVRYSAEAAPWLLQLRIWNDSKKIKELGGAAARRLAIGTRGGLVEDMPYLLHLCADGRFREELVKTLDLDDALETFVVKESAKLRPVQRRSPGRQPKDR